MSEPGSVDSVGQIVPDYELLQQIGQGAYGEVWLARSKATGVLRAAKIVRRHKFDEDRPFQREFEGIQRFERISREHPGQLALFHIGRNETEGYFYYVMELADNLGTETDYKSRTLRADLRQGRLPAERVLQLGVRLAKVLGYLHQNGLIHRDVKPSNVIFVNGEPKLADLGLLTDASDRCSEMGTRGYVPEQGLGTPQADLFALGKVLYEAATGFDRLEFPKLPENLRSWPDAKEVFEINAIVLKACAKDPGGRYVGAESMLKDLEHLQQGKSIKRKHALQGYWAIGRKVAVGLAGLAVVVAMVAVLTQGRATALATSDGPNSTNELANALCRRGLNIVRDDSYERFGEAHFSLQEAARLDTNFAKPFVGLLELGLREHPRDLKAMTTVELTKIATRLGELATNSAPAYCAQAAIAFNECEFQQAEQFAKNAIKANKGYELGHTYYAFMLTLWKRTDEARKELAKSESLLSGKATIPRVRGHIEFAERHFERAIEQYDKALDIERHHAPALEFKGRAYQALRDYAKAIKTFREWKSLSITNESSLNKRFDGLLNAYNDYGELGYWRFYLHEIEQQPKPPNYWKAVVLLRTERTNEALKTLALCALKPDPESGSYQNPVVYLLFDEHWDALYDDERFQNLLLKFNFKKVIKEPKKARKP